MKQRRRAIVSHVMSGECTYRPGQVHMNEWMMVRYPEHPAPGEKFRGPQFRLGKGGGVDRAVALDGHTQQRRRRSAFEAVHVSDMPGCLSVLHRNW